MRGSLNSGTRAVQLSGGRPCRWPPRPTSGKLGSSGAPLAPSLLHLGNLGVATLRELRARGRAVRRGEAPRISSVAPVGLLCAEPLPYVRAAVEAGAAMVGLRVVTYGPEEVARLGDPTVAGTRLGALHAALLGAKLAPAVLSAMASAADCPVIEAGGSGGDPAGALADLWVLERALGGLDGKKLCWVGDATGLLHDLMVAGCAQGLSVAVAHPVGFAPDIERVIWARERAAVRGAAVLVTTELAEAVADAHAVYAESWPEGAADRFRGYAVQRHALRGLRGGAAFLHRAPERRGPEMSASFAEEPGWLAIEQSRARADAWAALFAWMLQPDPLRTLHGRG